MLATNDDIEYFILKVFQTPTTTYERICPKFFSIRHVNHLPLHDRLDLGYYLLLQIQLLRDNSFYGDLRIRIPGAEQR